MLKIVSKFGGTSLCSSKHIKRVGDLIKSLPDSQVIVVSAIAGVTDLLENFVENIGKRSGIIDYIISQHDVIAQELGIHFDTDIVGRRLHPFISKEVIEPFEKASILSLGEDLSSQLVANYLNEIGLSVCKLEARDIILTDDHYDHAVPDIDLMRAQWQQLNLELEKRYLIQGYIGANTKGETTLLGRGGSDYTASLIAELSNASQVYIYTDVSGIYTVDPSFLETAKRLEEVSYEDMLLMATCGAEVLYPPMLRPCIRSNIPIFISSSINPSLGGTWVKSAREDRKDNIFNAIAIKRLIELWTIPDSFESPLITLALKYNVPVDFVFSKDTATYMLLTDKISLKNKQALFKEASKDFDINIHNNMSILTMIGDSIPSELVALIHHELFLKFPDLICDSFSDRTLSVICQDSVLKEIVNTLHSEYVLNSFYIEKS